MKPELEKIVKQCKNPQVLKQVVGKLIPISELMGTTTDKNLYCPFHDDEGGGKPSAKIYKHDTDGIEKLWCYSEGHVYTSYDYIQQVLHDSPLKRLLELPTIPDIDQTVQQIKHQTETYHKEQVSEIQEIARNSKDVISFFNVLYRV